ncbi:hypothetical protein ABIE20_005345 [Pseudomonas sp. 2835]
MRGFGILVIVVGVLLLGGAMVMDVSVPAGLGRVNNLGLMAERQNYTIIGGILLIAGILMNMRGGRGSSDKIAASYSDTRACPQCAEQIKLAAVKCRFCGAEAEAVAPPKLKHGWVASVPCRPGEDQERARAAIEALGLPAVPMDGANIGAGPFATKDEAKVAAKRLSGEQSVFATVDYRDTVSGKFPPLPD